MHYRQSCTATAERNSTKRIGGTDRSFKPLFGGSAAGINFIKSDPMCIISADELDGSVLAISSKIRDFAAQ